MNFFKNQKRSLQFDDIDNLINVITQYMKEYNLNDLNGGYRNSTSHFQNIVEIYFKKNKSELRLEALNLYVKWKRNNYQIKTRVQKNLKDSLYKLSKDIEEQNGKEIIFSSDEWNEIKNSINTGRRKKILSCANKIISEKIQSSGVNSKNFWNGTLICQKCSILLKAIIEKKPVNNENCIIFIQSQSKFCQERVCSSLLSCRLTGKKREEIQLNVVSKGAINYRVESDYFDKLEKQKISYENLRKMKSQFRHRFQLVNDFRIDSDAAKLVFDFLVPKTLSTFIVGYIQEICSNPFGSLLTSDIQLKMWAIIKENNPIWYFDATGNIMPIFKGQKEIFLFSLICHDLTMKTLIPVADFLSSSHNSITIYCYLKKIFEKFNKYPIFQFPKVIVTDFSWANIHACIRALNNLETLDYLILAFEILVKKNVHASLKIRTVVYICSTHILKNVINETEKIISSNKNNYTNHLKKTFICSFSLLQNSISIEEFCEILKCIQIVYCSKYKSELLKKHMAKLQYFLSKRNIEWLNYIQFSQSNESKNTKNFIFIENSESNISKNSPFTSYFQEILEKNQKQINEEVYSSEKNSFFCENLIEIIRKKIHLFPLWTGSLVNKEIPNKTRVSNNSVECWFKILKNNIINTNKKVRSSRLLFLSEISAPLYFYLESKYKNFYQDKINAKYCLSKIAKKKEYNEMWQFKTKSKNDANYYTSHINIANYENLSWQEDIDKIKLSSFENEKITKTNKDTEYAEISEEKLCKMDVDTCEDDEDYKFIYFKIDDFLIQKGRLKEILENKWLSDNEMMAFGSCLMKKQKKKITLLDCIFATQIFYQGEIKIDFGINKFAEFENCDVITGFINENNNHWTLMYIEIKTNEVYYIDPKAEKEENKIKFFQNWKKFSSGFGMLSKKKWKLKQINHSVQNDSHNCGVIACFFLENLLNGKELNFCTAKNSMEKKRFEMIQVFKSETSLNFCSKCGKDLEKEVAVNCECFHKFHKNCQNSLTTTVKCPVCL